MTERPRSQVRSIDVARLAGVSRSAVSRAFTPGAYISAGTRDKVVRAADALGYAPNALARSLITKRTGIVGIVSTDLDNPFYATLLQKLGTALQEADLTPFLLFGDENSTDRQIARMLSYQVDALAMTNATLSSKMAARFAAADRPIVAINRSVAHSEITSITCDNAAAMALVVDHLVALDCRRIAFIAGVSETSSSRDREAGFLRRMAFHGISPAAIVTGHYSHRGGAEAAQTLLSRETRPDALICANDLMAFGAMDVARDSFDLRIPADLKITGFDNSSLADWSSHALTSVDQDIAGMVNRAVACIIDGISGRAIRTRHITVPGQLVIRGSTQSDIAISQEDETS